MVWLKATERRSGYLFDQSCALLGFMPAGIVKLGVEHGELEVDESVSLLGLKSSSVASLDKSIPRKLRKGARKVRIRMLSEAMSSS